LKPVKQSILSPLSAAVVSIDITEGQLVDKNQIVAVLESMKMQTAIHAPIAGVVANLSIVLDATIQAGQLICEIESADTQNARTSATVAEAVPSGTDNGLTQLNQELAYSQDDARPDAVARRHARGYRTARENLYGLCDPDSFIEYGQLAVAAQRDRKTANALKMETPADGVITGLATINGAEFGEQVAQGAGDRQ